RLKARAARRIAAVSRCSFVSFVTCALPVWRHAVHAWTTKLPLRSRDRTQRPTRAAPSQGRPATRFALFQARLRSSPVENLPWQGRRRNRAKSLSADRHFLVPEFPCPLGRCRLPALSRGARRDADI